MNNLYDDVTLVNKSGRVVRAKRWEVENLRNYQGMRLIFNPKQEYYPEYDQSIVRQREQQILVDRSEDPDVLQYEEL